MSIGMSPEEFWEGESDLTEAYRKADEYRRRDQNYRLWLEGMYMYDTLCRVAPIYRFTSEKRVKPLPYIAEPYPIDPLESKRREERQRKKKEEKMKAAFADFVCKMRDAPRGTDAVTGGENNGGKPKRDDN